MTADQHAMTLRLDQPLWRRVRQSAFDREMTVSDVIREAVDQHVAASVERTEQ